MTLLRSLIAVSFISVCFSALLWTQSQLIFQTNLENLPENRIYRGSVGAMTDAQRQSLKFKLQEARSAVGQAPVSQSLLNTYYVFNSQLGNFNLKDREQFLSHVGKHGWRHTAYLQNQILNAIERADLKTVIVVADALLRQAKIIENSYALLFLAEADETARSLLVERLNSNPDWRSRFFSDTDTLMKTAQLNARVLTIETMLAKGYSVSRQEIAPAVVALIQAGRFGAAYELGELAASQEQNPRSKSNKTAGLSDATESALPMPSEWSARKGTGYETRLLKANDKYYFDIDWNGRGRPVLLQRMIQLDQKPYIVEIMGKISPDAVELSIICPESSTYVLNFIPSVSQRTRYVFETQASPSCKFGYLRLTGRGAFGNKPKVFRIEDIGIK
ncbi:MAG: hypothetical protein COA41_01935 [Sphingopyxis sp.]|nr:MAG: hypothetical protein COA41_01935 [Sphingopyxis sp.]